MDDKIWKEVTFPAKIKKTGGGAHIMIPLDYVRKIGASIDDDVIVTVRIPEYRE